MTLKAVSVDPAETIYSVIARLAAVNGSGNARALRRHLGVPYMNYDHATEAMDTISVHSGISAELLAAATYRPHGKRHVDVGGSIVARRQISRSAPRYCALCVLEDFEQRSGRPITRPFQRCSWTVEDVDICHIHGIRLVRAKGPDSLRHEFVLAVSEKMSVVEVEAARAEHVHPSQSEIYFAARLDKKAKPVPDLHGLPYYVARDLCARLGILDAGGPAAHLPKSRGELASACERGFNLIGETAGGLRFHLTGLTKTYWKPRRAQGAQHVFGSLYRHLALHMDDDHRSLIDIVKEVAVDNLPLGPTDNFLGQLRTRRWHSALSLSRELRISPNRVVSMLTREGFIPPQSGFERDSFSQIIVDAELATPVFRRQELVDRMTLTRRMRLDRFRNTCIFAKEGSIALRPHPDEAGVFRLYSIADAENLLARMTTNAGNAVATDFCRPREAAQRSLCSVDEVLELLGSGDLKQILYHPEYMFEGILVSPAEVRTKTKSAYPGWVHPYEIALRLGISSDDAAHLIRNQIIKGEWINYRFGTAIVTTLEVVDDLDHRHLSLAALAKLEEIRPSDLARKLAKKGISPAILGVNGRPLFYYRHDIDA
ncbi:TniQ family protein [Agrobacterium sp. NPDC090283]|uniref:TniQ family protein n=1 Tax=Agrobacterium sp. NPDC090283 TaxID=3363920 RepID=UPI00383A4F4B